MTWTFDTSPVAARRLIAPMAKIGQLIAARQQVIDAPAASPGRHGPFDRRRLDRPP
ncbi:hypothetical protein [Paracoccus haematequi]|uniref:hypothetical protein n=1 Tax=Paracoccus haematequi TaxID=2491866 RepID=UPI0013DFF248|nr:hypothetical protein [Paracoccus haematequi]